MGLTMLTIEIANPAKPTVWQTVELLVDSGAVYSVIPSKILRGLGIRRLRKDEFALADGSKVVRGKGVAWFKYDKWIGGGDVIFGEPGDSPLLGALTLEALGLSLDPLRRELKPLQLILGGWRPDPPREERRRSAV
jgi:predicted aspartyl protease